MCRIMLAGIIILAIVGTSNNAWSTPVFYDFSVEVQDGVLSGQTLTGSFSLDESVIAGTGFLFDFDGLGVLDSFDLSFGGFDFDASNADLTLLAFTNGEIDRFLAAGAPSGFNRIMVSDDQADFSIVSDGECPGNCPFLYDLDDSTSIATGSPFSFQRRIPEPATLELLLLAAAMALQMRRPVDVRSEQTLSARLM